MFIYEKDGKLCVVFQPTQLPVEEPDVVIAKVDGETQVLVDGVNIVTSEEE